VQCKPREGSQAEVLLLEVEELPPEERQEQPGDNRLRRNSETPMNPASITTVSASGLIRRRPPASAASEARSSIMGRMLVRLPVYRQPMHRKPIYCGR
jgi:hypothetical protein